MGSYKAYRLILGCERNDDQLDYDPAAVADELYEAVPDAVMEVLEDGNRNPEDHSSIVGDEPKVFVDGDSLVHWRSGRWWEGTLPLEWGLPEYLDVEAHWALETWEQEAGLLGGAGYYIHEDDGWDLLLSDTDSDLGREVIEDIGFPWADSKHATGRVDERVYKAHE